MENQEFTKTRGPTEYLKIFFRRKWLFIIPVYIGFVLSIGACLLLAPTYESETLILVEEEKIINPLIQGLAVSTSAAQRMQTIREQILGWNSLVELTKKLNLAKDAATQKSFEDLILNLRRNIYVQMRSPNIIKISYFGKEPHETQLITKTLTDILVDQNMREQTKETDVAISFIKEQLEVYKRKIKETEIADYEEQLKKLLLDSTEQHPVVKDLRHKIAAARKELESGEYKVTVSKKAENDPAYLALKEEIGKISSDGVNSVDTSVAYASTAGDSIEPNQAIYKLMLMDKFDTVLARDKNVNENIYNMLLQKLETAKITQRLEASKQGTRYTIIDPPRLPLSPAKPNKVKVMLLGIFLGCVTGVGGVFAREFLDHSFIDIEDAKDTLALPVLGGISRITTQDEINNEKYRRKFYFIAGLVSSFAFILISVFIWFFKN